MLNIGGDRGFNDNFNHAPNLSHYLIQSYWAHYTTQLIVGLNLQSQETSRIQCTLLKACSWKCHCSAFDKYFDCSVTAPSHKSVLNQVSVIPQYTKDTHFQCFPRHTKRFLTAVLAEHPVILTETKTYLLTTCSLKTELLARENE